MVENLKLWPNVRWMAVVLAEDESENAPPWGVLDVVKTVVINEQICFEVKKPTTANTRCVVFNGEQVLKTKDNNDGRRHIGNCTIDFPCQVLVDSQNVSDLATLWVESGKWELTSRDPLSGEEEPCGYNYYKMGDGGVIQTAWIDQDQCPKYPVTTTMTVITSFGCINSVITWCKADFSYHLCGHALGTPSYDSCQLATTAAP